jgi:hypothetical protein
MFVSRHRFQLPSIFQNLQIAGRQVVYQKPLFTRPSSAHEPDLIASFALCYFSQSNRQESGIRSSDEVRIGGYVCEPRPSKDDIVGERSRRSGIVFVGIFGNPPSLWGRLFESLHCRVRGTQTGIEVSAVRLNVKETAKAKAKCQAEDRKANESPLSIRKARGRGIARSHVMI